MCTVGSVPLCTHPVNAFPLKNEISCTEAVRIRQHIDTIAKCNCFPGSIKKTREVGVILAANKEDFRISFKRTELFARYYCLQRTDPTYE